MVFLVALLHELGHLLAAKLLGYCVHGIKVHPFGVSLNIFDQKISNTHEIVISVAGPMVNVILLSGGIVALKNGVYCSDLFFISNFYILLVNLIPVLPLDGGRIFRSLFISEASSKNNEKIFKFISFSTALILLAVGTVFFIKTKQNLSLLLIALFLLDGLRLHKNKPNSVANMFFSKLKYGNSKVFYFDENVLIKEALKFMPYDDVNIAFILDHEGKIAGVVSNKYVLKLMSEGYGNKRFVNIIDFE